VPYHSEVEPTNCEIENSVKVYINLFRKTEMTSRLSYNVSYARKDIIIPWIDTCKILTPYELGGLSDVGPGRK